MAIIKKKIWPAYFELVKTGVKKSDVRLNDFAVKKGDKIIFEEWDPRTKNYTGRSFEKSVTHVYKFRINEFFFSEEEINKKGLQVISLDE